MKEDAAETGLLNGNGRTLRLEGLSLSLQGTLPGRVAELPCNYVRNARPKGAVHDGVTSFDLTDRVAYSDRVPDFTRKGL